MNPLRIPIWQEARIALERAALSRDPVLRGQGVARGDGMPVLLIPGFMAGDLTLSLMSHWLRSQGYAVAFSEWNSSPLVKETTRRGKKKEMFTPTTFSLMLSTDFADRMERYIVPLLKAGAIVCADRAARCLLTSS